MKNYLRIFSLLLLSGFTTNLLAQSAETGTIRGVVVDEKDEVITGASIGIETENKGDATDEEGRFLIEDVQPGSYRLIVTAVGYTRQAFDVEVKAGATAELDIQMETSRLEMDEVVVTGTMRETFVKDSPVKVQVIGQEFLDKNSSENIMESVNYINGLHNQVGCGVCGTNEVRINGMDGPYTSVLIDGMPIMGALASVYGLNGINPSIIQSVEITKGPNSTLYGSEAMAGVINIRTKHPSQAPEFSLNSTLSSHSESAADLSFAPSLEFADVLFSGSGFYFDTFMDQNDDAFADIPLQQRLSLFNKWSFNRPDDRIFDVAVKYNTEDRLGGVEAFRKSMRGSESVYGEAIQTDRVELVGSYQLPVEKQHLRVDFSYNYHDQNSWYGDYNYDANQQIFHTNVLWDKRIDAERQLLIGGTFRYDALDQTFDEIRLENGSEDNRVTPGLFAQYEHIFNPDWRIMAGGRLDHYPEHGTIFSPRLNLKVDPFDHTTVRFNTGTGFRIVNLFTEEHEALSGSRSVILDEELNPERSYNATLNINQIVDIGLSVLNIDLDMFYTHFTNQIIPDYSRPNEIRYGNLDEYSVTRGISLNAAHNFPGPLQYSVGVTAQEVFQMIDDRKESVHFAPEMSGVFTLSYAFEPVGITLDWTGRVMGEMKLPDYTGYEDHSRVFTEQNLRVGKSFTNGLELYASVKNLFNYVQKDPLVAPDRPFSNEFATDRVYGPLQGRRALLGLKYEFK
ncbi:MAG: TonB-dependent receptor [Balneolaceae bacterium]